MGTSDDSRPGARGHLSVELDESGTGARLVLAGELDVATVGIAEDAISSAKAGANPLILDLRELSFLDSSGLRLILVTAESTNNGGPEVFVVRGPAQVNRVFELTGAGERLNLVDDPSLIEHG